MSGIKEIIVVSSSIESPLIAWDLNTGTQEAQFKQISTPQNGLCVVGRDYVAAVQATQTSGGIFFWLWNKVHPSISRCIFINL